MKIITPSVNLSISFKEYDFFLETGSDFGVNISVTHDSMDPRDAHNLVIFLEYPQQYVLPPNNFTLLYSNGTLEFYSKFENILFSIINSSIIHYRFHCC